MALAETFESIRNPVVERLVAKRGAVDHVYPEIGEHDLASLFDVVLAKIYALTVDDDVDSFREFVRRWTALRLGAGAIHDNLIPAFVAIGDELIDAMQKDVRATAEIWAFVRKVARANHIAARQVVEMLADDFSGRGGRMREMTVVDGDEP